MHAYYVLFRALLHISDTEAVYIESLDKQPSLIGPKKTDVVCRLQ